MPGIGVTRGEGELIEQRKIVCPYEQRVCLADKFRIPLFLTVLFVPLFPVSHIFEWGCRSCGKRVVPNAGGSYHKVILARNAGCLLIGLLMTFMFGSWVIWVPDAFDKSNLNGVRIFLGIFLVCGLAIVAFTIVDTRRLLRALSYAGPVSEEKMRAIEAGLEVGDNPAQALAKLKAQGHSEQEIMAFAAAWAAAES